MNKIIYKNAYKKIILDLRMQTYSICISDTVIPLSCFYFINMIECDKEKLNILRLQNDFYNSYYSKILHKLNHKVYKDNTPIVFFFFFRDNVVIADVYFRKSCLIKSYQKVCMSNVGLSYSYLMYVSTKGKIIKYLKYIW